MNNPIKYFNQLYRQELKHTAVKIPSACCFTTIGVDGFPNSRFVSCKEVVNDRFIITGNKKARKGIEARENNKVALAFWWTSTNIQVRVQGVIKELDFSYSETYFKGRNRESQIVSTVSNQGEELSDIAWLEQAYMAVDNQYKEKSLPTPESFGVWAIIPYRIEFLIFNDSRFHERVLYEQRGGVWKKTFLKP
ncbi:pyridoxine/pyridoxamine 5'-phosphate oxidase [Myroides indicus]|uniref:Pyridoxamine 5'-phosphate oxidase n=1 Tax=Myroides indicus TaxID=1323422 RepID=A0A4R7EQH1_9FLAO|nr:pyridoxal 5'-phosphate synthase [Myroides indicus]TDS52717.1 pyridoxamine 5'-phosphate oxidase [Myroides indicus]